LVAINPDCVPSVHYGSDGRGTRPDEWIQHGISRITERKDATLG
jgi:hypothetical protein